MLRFEALFAGQVAGVSSDGSGGVTVMGGGVTGGVVTGGSGGSLPLLLLLCKRVAGHIGERCRHDRGFAACNGLIHPSHKRSHLFAGHVFVGRKRGRRGAGGDTQREDADHGVVGERVFPDIRKWMSRVDRRLA